MTIIIGIVLVVVVTLFMLLAAVKITILENDVARLKRAASPNHPASRTTTKEAA